MYRKFQVRCQYTLRACVKIRRVSVINKRAKHSNLAATFVHVWNDMRKALTTDLKIPVGCATHILCKYTRMRTHLRMRTKFDFGFVTR